jgi:hypothetical protein
MLFMFRPLQHLGRNLPEGAWHDATVRKMNSLVC